MAQSRNPRRRMAEDNFGYAQAATLPLRITEAEGPDRGHDKPHRNDFAGILRCCTTDAIFGDFPVGPTRQRLHLGRAWG